MKPGLPARLMAGHPLSKGLIGCWLMNEGSGGLVRDLSGYVNSGTTYGQMVWRAGMFGSALDLDGASGYVGQPAGAIHDTLANDNRTISAWIYPHTLPGYPYVYIVSQGKTGAFDYYARLASWYLQAGNTDGATTCYPTIMTANKWYHIVVVFSAAGAIGYVNGGAGTLVDRKTKASLSGNNLEIGRSVSGVGYFDGLIDHVMIYKRALSASEVVWLYRAPFCMFATRPRPELTPKPKKLVEWWTGEPLGCDAGWVRDAIFNGASADAFKLGTALTGGWFWIRRSGCLALYRGEGAGEIDFANILSVGEADAQVIAPPTYLPQDDGTTRYYVVRRFNCCGYDERSLEAVVKVGVDAGGELVGEGPNSVFGPRVKQVGGGRVRLVWFYCPLEQKTAPVRFNIYYDNRTGQVDYDTPLATVDYRGRRYYRFESGSLEAGRYLFAICTEDQAGVEQTCAGPLKIEIDQTSPAAINILEAGAL
jgi:hypothetical protein